MMGRTLWLVGGWASGFHSVLCLFSLFMADFPIALPHLGLALALTVSFFLEANRPIEKAHAKTYILLSSLLAPLFYITISNWIGSDGPGMFYFIFTSVGTGLFLVAGLPALINAYKCNRKEMNKATKTACVIGLSWCGASGIALFYPAYAVFAR